MPRRSETVGPGAFRDEEKEWLREGRNAATEGRWDDAFLNYQRLLASVRDRRDLRTERTILLEFSDLLIRSGEPERGARVLRYLESGFSPRDR